MAVSKVHAKGKAIFYKDITVTTGTTQYDSHYFGDYTNAVPSGYSPISVAVVTAAYNALFIPQIMGQDVRVWSLRSSTTATVRVAYSKD